MKVVVCGAGVNGISCALWLRRAGVDVTLIDRAEPASGASYGNAGVLAAGSVIPVTTPGLVKKAPFMLFDRDAPLFMRIGYLPRLAPFLGRYLAHATTGHVQRYAKAMTGLLIDCVEQHQTLAEGTAAADYITPDDYCFAYKTQEDHAADQWAWDLRASLGHAFEVISGRDFAHLEPLYGDNFDVIVQNKNHGRVSDPGAYLRALCEEFTRIGGVFLKGDVQDLNFDGDRLASISTTAGVVAADKFAFTLGPWSGSIAKQLGLSVPFESEGGYHIELVNPSEMPGRPVMVASGKFVVTPMKGRLRLAGVVDFSGLDGPDNQAAIDLLKKNATALFPNLHYDRLDFWHGHRPTTANSLPLIGQIARYPNAFVGFGHQHVGLTGGAKTGALLQKLIRGETPEIDMSAFDPNAYA